MQAKDYRLVSAVTAVQLEQVEALYMLAFPPAERKPFSMILRTRTKGRAEILTIESADGAFAGEAITVQCGSLVLVDYLAVSEAMRGQGVGSAALRLLRERYAGKTVFLEIESTKETDAPNREQREKRKAFYLRNGLSCMPFRAVEFGVEMEVLTFSGEVTFDDLHGLYQSVFGRAVAANIRRYGDKRFSLLAQFAKRRK
ncbi:MAG: hypothetical protein K1V97_01250 [Lachnospiraceae bacterium]